MDSSDPVVQSLLQRNAEWAAAVAKVDPDFFVRSAQGQSPQVLWIGCSDSRVPGSTVTNSKPGDLFLHKNIASQVHLTDDNVLSVIDFAVVNLKVKHVIVIGHTECGGAKHCLEESRRDPPTVPPSKPLDRWLEPLIALARDLHAGSLPPAEGLSLLVRENVKRQVENVVQTDTIKEAWGHGEDVWIHGLIYDLSKGLLSDLEVTRGRPKN